MRKFAALVALTICSFACCEARSVAQDQFKKLSGPEIRAKFIGMEFTDEVHWGEVYEPNGKLTSEEMGKKRVGTWRIEKNQLCTDYGKDVGSNCYEVWVSGKNVQLRVQDSPALPAGRGSRETAPLVVGFGEMPMNKPKQRKGIVAWIDHRLPIFSFLRNELDEYPTPRNLNYLWNFGSLAGIVLVIMIDSAVLNRYPRVT